MKKLMLACATIALLSAGFSANAQTVNTTTAATVKADDNKTQVDPATLPDAVKATLGSDAYKGWTVGTAYLVKTGSSEYYEIQLSKDNEKNTVKLDKDGKTV